MPRAPKSRFGSLAGKKVEKQVRKYATLFYVNNRRGHGVATGAKHRGKLIMHINIGHISKVLSNEKLASSTMNSSKINKRDNVANGAHRQDNAASFKVRQTPITDKSIKQSNSYAMHVNLATLSRINNKRSVAGEANRQANHGSRPVKQDPPRNNTNTKRVEALRSSEDYDPLKAKTTMNRPKHINNSQSPQFKAMARLVHNTKNFDGLDEFNGSLPSRLKSKVSRDNEGGFIVGKHSDIKLTVKAIEEASPKRMKKQIIKESKVDDTGDRNIMGEINGDACPVGVKDYYSERNLTYGPMKKQRSNTETNEDEAIDNDHMKLMEVEDGGTQLETRDHRRKNNKNRRGIELIEVGGCKLDDRFAKKKIESLPKDHVSLDCSNEARQLEKQTHRKLKKRGQDMGNEDEELHVDGGDHSLLGDDGDSSRFFTLQAPFSIDSLADVPTPFVLEHVKRQCNFCSKPLDKPIWSGFFKFDRDGYISLAGHLSNKSCDKVWKLSRSLKPVVEVTKLSRSTVKIWETSKPSCDSIGLYFFPNKLRHDEDLDKLVKEVIEDDLILQTVIGEAEILIFPSTLLPERYKTFQGKHYLWGVFRPRQDQCATAAEAVRDTVCCAQEKENVEQHASNQQDEVQEVHWKSPDKSMQQAAASSGVPGSPHMGFQLEAPEERQLGVGDALRHSLHNAEATAVATDPAAVTTEAAATGTAEATEHDNDAAPEPAEATENDANAATIPGNHGRSDPIVGVPSGRFFCFVAGQTPKLEQLIQEMQREGSLVVAIRGEAIGAGLWPGNIASTNISGA